MPAKAEETLIVGKISGFYGVKGWVKVFSWTEPRENILDYPVWLIGPEGQFKEFRLADGRVHGKGIIAKLHGVDSPEAAAVYLGMDIAIQSADLPELEDGEFYWRDLLGLQVVNLQDVVLGTVKGFMETGSNDVLVIKGDRERLVPWVRPDFIKSVDLEQGRVTVDWDADF